METAAKAFKFLMSFPFNIIVGMIVLAMFYHFFLFFAYDLNPNYLKIHNCKQVEGTWDGIVKKCTLRAQ